MSNASKRPHAEQLRRDRGRIVASLMEREPDLTTQLVQVDEQLARLRADIPDNEFAQHRSGIDAVLAYLDHTGTFTDSSTIIDSLIWGGYAAHDDNRRANLRDAIFYHTTKSGRLQRRASDGAIGKPEWTEQN